ncbi:DUF6095 family protein [Gramella sp. AN32]|uniref:DUF6095 family protein n=1 Tax=Christiangramia antarctica TaxID=2058158 RepID=A0ABW5X7X4_9FLAO|nr:DUF6095 family protein [Gramella sp. AN32]MCM4157920.1 hypothetical protein [Gramella sp. AN32]
MKHTNKEVLYKGLKYLAAALPLSLIGPTVLYSAFKNQDHPLFWVVISIGFLVLLSAIFLMFKGILTIVKSMFD